MLSITRAPFAVRRFSSLRRLVCPRQRTYLCTRDEKAFYAAAPRQRGEKATARDSLHLDDYEAWFQWWAPSTVAG